ACGSGAVASAILLTTWGLATGPVALRTRSGRVLRVRLEREGVRWVPSLAGEGRIVFRGALGDVLPGSVPGSVSPSEAAARAG
ncbi:MAG TPA: hypothetical protein VEA99_11400, partial [Gemmatimonadaceae bacterium]|nr:hypothetical protein [Gemmatimonadaceae bacterium]